MGVNMVLVWICVFGICVAIEIATLGLATIWFAAGSLGGLLVAALDGPLALQIVVFTVVSVLLLMAVRPMASKHLNNRRTRTNVEEVIGKVGIVTEAVNNIAGTGRVSLSGNDWMARSVDDREFSEGDKVVVKEVQGVKLIVESV